jgi:hypothetical protein
MIQWGQEQNMCKVNENTVIVMKAVQDMNICTLLHCIICYTLQMCIKENIFNMQ